MEKYGVTLSITLTDGSSIVIGSDEFGSFALITAAKKAIADFAAHVAANDGLYPDVASVGGGTIYENATDKVVVEF